MEKRQATPAINSTRTRNFQIETRALQMDEQARTVELAFSSEVDYEFWPGEVERLMHDPKSVRMDRLKGGAALLLNHDTERQIGVVESARIDKDRVGRAVVRFSRSALGEEIMQDVRDGIRQLVSVGYRIHAIQEERDGGTSIYHVTDWEPTEISIVSVPADPTVGVGRSLLDSETEGEERADNGEPSISTNTTMSAAIATPTAEPATITPPAIDVNAERENARQAARVAEETRCRGIAAVQAAHPQIAGIRERAEKAIREGEELADFQGWALVQMGARQVDTDPNIGLSNKEVQQFGLVNAIRSVIAGGGVTGLEKEASDAVAAKINRRPTNERSFFIPTEVARSPFTPRQRDLTAGNFTGAGALVGEDLRPQDMIELLRNKQFLPSVGARMLTGLMGDVAIPRQSGGATAYWTAEATALTESQQTVAQVVFTPKRLGAFTDYSRQLMVQSSTDIENFVRTDLMTVIALERDRAALYGTGGVEPLGLVNQSGIGSVTFGGAPVWADVVEFETDVAAANAEGAGMAWVTSAAVRGRWKTAEKASGYPVYLWPDNGQPNGYPAVVTNQVSDNVVFFGVWSNLVIADWAGMEVIVDPYTQATSGLIRVVIQMLTDVGIRQAGAFSVSTDSGAQA